MDNKATGNCGSITLPADDIINDDDQLNGADSPCDLPSEWRSVDNSMMSSNVPHLIVANNDCNKEALIFNDIISTTAHKQPAGVITVDATTLCSDYNSIDSACNTKSSITFFCQNLDELRDDYIDNNENATENSVENWNATVMRIIKFQKEEK